MKTIIAMLAIFSAPALADTIQTTAGFGALHQYHDADTTDGNTITLYLPQSGTGVALLYVNDGPQYVCPGFAAFPAQNVPTVSSCTADDGSTLLLTITETWYRKAVNMGRLHTYQTRWTLVTGEIT